MKECSKLHLFLEKEIEDIIERSDFEVEYETYGDDRDGNRGIREISDDSFDNNRKKAIDLIKHEDETLDIIVESLFNSEDEMRNFVNIVNQDKKKYSKLYKILKENEDCEAYYVVM